MEILNTITCLRVTVISNVAIKVQSDPSLVNVVRKKKFMAGEYCMNCGPFRSKKNEKADELTKMVIRITVTTKNVNYIRGYLEETNCSETGTKVGEMRR